MGPIGCPETSVRNYHCYLRNNPEERSCQVFVALGIQHAYAHAPFCYMWPARLCNIFPRYLLIGTIFEKNVEHERLF
jgi:hypothetical protein